MTVPDSETVELTENELNAREEALRQAANHIAIVVMELERQGYYGSMIETMWKLSNDIRDDRLLYQIPESEGTGEQ